MNLKGRTPIAIGVAVVTGTGAAAQYFLDPDEGRRRRHMARDRFVAALRGGSRQARRGAERTAQQAADRAYGAAHEMARAVDPERRRAPGELDDTTLARTVETNIFSDADVPKGSIDVLAENGVVQLRGEVKQPEQIEDIGRRTAGIDGVVEVINLLHLPGTPAPTIEDRRDQVGLRAAQR